MDLYTSKLEYIHLALCWFGHILGILLDMVGACFGHITDMFLFAQASGASPIDRRNQGTELATR